MKKKIVKWGLGLLSILAVSIGVACSQGDPEVGQEQPVTIVYFYEKLDGSYEEIITTAFAKEGETVSAPEAPLLGYVLDSQNPDCQMVGKVKDENLTLKAIYKLIESDISINTTINAEVDLYQEDKQLSNFQNIKFGEEIRIEYSLPEGYQLQEITVKKEDGSAVHVVNNSFLMPETDVVIELLAEEAQTTYIVEHFYKSGAEFVLYQRDTKEAKLNEVVYADALNHAGFTLVQHANSKSEGLVSSEEQLVLSLYYETNSFSVTKQDSSDVSKDEFSVDKSGTAKFLDKVFVNVSKQKVGYHSQLHVVAVNGDSSTDVEVIEEINGYYFYMPACNVNIWVSFVPNEDTVYYVEHYFADLSDGEFTLFYTEEKEAETNSIVSASQLQRNGFVFDETNENNVIEAAVLADGSLALKVYYQRSIYQIQFKDYDGTTDVFEPLSLRYGEPLPAVPNDSYADGDNIFYWVENGKAYSADGIVERDMIITKSKFTQTISSKEEFYQAFGLVQNGDGIYQTTETVAQSFILLDHIDFGGDCINIKNFSGVLQGNGFSLRSIKSKFQMGIFETMQGEIYNLAFENIIFEPWFNAWVDIKNEQGEKSTGILGRSGLLAVRLSGKLENVYVQGDMLGDSYAYIYWDGKTPNRHPSTNDEGNATSGILAYDASGATLKNIIIDVNTCYRQGRTTDLYLVTGKGAFVGENIFVVSTGESFDGVPASKGLASASAGVACATVKNLSDSIFTALGEKILKSNFVIRLEARRSPFNQNIFLPAEEETTELPLIFGFEWDTDTPEIEVLGSGEYAIVSSANTPVASKWNTQYTFTNNAYAGSYNVRYYNTNNGGYGVKIHLNYAQRLALANGGLLSFAMKVAPLFSNSVTYKLTLNGTEITSVTATLWPSYAMYEITDVTLLEQIATDGFIYFQLLQGTAETNNYYMWLDDIAIIEPENSTKGVYFVERYLQNEVGEFELVDNLIAYGEIGATTNYHANDMQQADFDHAENVTIEAGKVCIVRAYYLMGAQLIIDFENDDARTTIIHATSATVGAGDGYQGTKGLWVISSDYVEIQVRLTSDQIAAIKAGGTLSFVAAGRTAAWESGANISIVVNGLLTLHPNSDWSQYTQMNNRGQSYTITNANVLADIAEKGYISFKVKANNTTITRFVLDDIEVTENAQ